MGNSVWKKQGLQSMALGEYHNCRHIYQGLHMDFGGTSCNLVVCSDVGRGLVVETALTINSSPSCTLSSSDDVLFLPESAGRWTTVWWCCGMVPIGGRVDSSDDDDDHEPDDKRRLDGTVSRCTHASRCSTIRRPDCCRRSSDHCSANNSWTWPMHCRYPARYTSGPHDDGGVAFRFRYLTVISKISAFSSLFTRDKSCPAYSKR